MIIQSALSQSFVEVNGIALDAESKGTIEGVLIRAEGYKQSSISNEEGKFQMKLPANTHLRLILSHISYVNQVFHLDTNDSATSIQVTLQPDIIALKEVSVQQNSLIMKQIDRSQSVAIADKEFLERNNTGTFSGAIASLPGINSMNVGVGIGKPMVRGMSFNRILVNNRGIKQEGQQWGADHGLEVDPFDVDRVEIIKGPASLLYGPDALGGVINIKPEPIPESNSLKLDLVSSYQSNNHAFSQSARISGRQNQWVYAARVTHQDYGDYGVPADEFTYAGFNLPIYENRLKNTAGEELHYSFMTGFVKDNFRTKMHFTSFNQTAGIFTGAIGIPRSYSLRHQGDFRDIELPRQENQHLMLVNQTIINVGANKLEIDLGVQRNSRKEFSFPEAHGVSALIGSSLALDLSLNTYTANVKYELNLAPNHQTLIGTQLQWSENTYGGFEFLLPAYTSSQLGAFAYHVWDINSQFVLNAGIRYDQGNHSIQQHLQPQYDRGTLEPTGELMERTPSFERNFENFSGGLGLNFILNPNNNFKLNIGNSFRFPSVIELASNGIHHGNFRHEIGDPDMTIEQGYQLDLSFMHESKKLFIELAGFYGYYNNYIYLSPTGRFTFLPAGGTMWEYRQDDAIFMGGELNAKYQLTQNFATDLGIEWVENLNINSKLPLPLTPPPSFQLNLEYTLSNNKVKGLEDTHFFTGVKQILAQNRIDRNERTTPAALLIHAGLGTDLLLKNQKIRLKVSVNNLLNTTYFNHISRYRLVNVPEQGRNFILSINIPLSLEK